MMNLNESLRNNLKTTFHKITVIEEYDQRIDTTIVKLEGMESTSQRKTSSLDLKGNQPLVKTSFSQLKKEDDPRHKK